MVNTTIRSQWSMIWEIGGDEHWRPSPYQDVPHQRFGTASCRVLFYPHNLQKLIAMSTSRLFPVPHIQTRVKFFSYMKD